MQVLETGQLVDSMGKRCDFRNAILVLTTSPTNAPLPTLAGPGSSSGGGGSSGGDGDPTVVSVLEGHVHPEAYAADASRPSTHTGHSAAALCLQPEEGSGGSSGAGGAGGQQAHRQARQAQQQAVHPLRYVPAELLARLDAALSMQPLSAADARRVVELQLADIQAALVQQGVQLRVDAAAQEWLAAQGLSPVSGAQRLRPLLREHLLLPVADTLLQRRLERQAGAGGAGADGAEPLAATATLAADGGRLDVSIN